MIAFVLALIQSAGDDSPPPGPLGAPSGLSTAPTLGPYMFYWTNGDTSASTRFYAAGVLKQTLGPGVSSWLSNYDRYGPSVTFEVRHYKNGQESAGATAVRIATEAP